MSAIDKFKNSGKPFPELLADWVKGAAAIMEKRPGVTVEVERTRTFFSGFTDPTTGLAYFDDFIVRSPYFPGASYYASGSVYFGLDGDEALLASEALAWFYHMTRIPIPPLPDEPKPPVPPLANPVGPPIDGKPGYFYTKPNDTLPVDAAYEPEGPKGPKWIKRGRTTPFGQNTWWEQVRPV